MVHKEIAELAYELANEAYEILCSKHNLFYAQNPNRVYWAKKNTGNFVAAAREALTNLLNDDNKTFEEKQRIMDILLAERSLPKGKISLKNQFRKIVT